MQTHTHKKQNIQRLLVEFFVYTHTHAPLNQRTTVSMSFLSLKLFSILTNTKYKTNNSPVK